MEEWKPIGGYENHYAISSTGRVKSLRRKKNSSPKILKGSLSGKGYRIVTLFDDHKPKKNFYIHRLVLEEFTGPCPVGEESRHLDGDKLNNSLSNLVWDHHQKTKLI